MGRGIIHPGTQRTLLLLSTAHHRKGADDPQVEDLLELLLTVYRGTKGGHTQGHHQPKHQPNEDALLYRMGIIPGVIGAFRQTAFVQQRHHRRAHHKLRHIRIIGNYSVQHIIGQLRIPGGYRQRKNIRITEHRRGNRRPGADIQLR